MLKRFLLVLAAFFAGFSMSAKELKVLMIGNSFSICVGRFMPQIVKSVPGHTLELTSAYIGGCTLSMHYNNLQKSEQDARHKPYKITCWDSRRADPMIKEYKGNVNELLKNNQYDIISIQQGSRECFTVETYEPYTAEIISYIKKYQKNAEIVIQQTWSYREDSARFEQWKLSQTDMYKKLYEAYHKLAANYQLRVIPMGTAIQLYREYTPIKYKTPDLNAFKCPKLPSAKGDVVGKFAWRNDKKTGGKILGSDSHHLNFRGEYMQAMLWFTILFNEPVSKIAYCPKKINPAEWALLKRCAQEAADKYPQVKK